jgi:hypothetical protein
MAEDPAVAGQPCVWTALMQTSRRNEQVRLGRGALPPVRLVKSTRTGSRGRGRGLRQTLDKQTSQLGLLTFGRKGDSGTAWATPLERAPFMLQYWCVVRY